MQKAKRVEILNDINVPKIIRDATPLDIPILSSDVRDIVFKNVEIRFNHYHKLGKRKHSKNHQKETQKEKVEKKGVVNHDTSGSINDLFPNL